MSRAALTWWLALVALTQGATAGHQSRPPPPSPSPPPPSLPAPWHRRTRLVFTGQYQSRDDAKDACAVGCLATSGCEYADLFFGTWSGSSTWATCYLKTNACGDYANNKHGAYSLFVKFAVAPN